MGLQEGHFDRRIGLRENGRPDDGAWWRGRPGRPPGGGTTRKIGRPLDDSSGNAGRVRPGETRVIGPPGVVPLPIEKPTTGRSHVFISDDTAYGDSWALWRDLRFHPQVLRLPTYHEHIQSWTDITLTLKRDPPNTVDLLILSGHGDYHGGVHTSRGFLDVPILRTRPDDVAILQSRLRSDATIVIAACGQGSGFHAPQMQELADLLDRRIVANAGMVNGARGEGVWYVFEPAR